MAINLETVKRRVAINLNPSTRPQVIDVSQYDKGYSLIFNIIEDQSNALKYLTEDPSALISATLQGVKPSGAGYSVDYSQFTEAYEVEFTLTEDMTAEAGDVLSEVVFYQNTIEDDELVNVQRIASANFILRVKKSPYPVVNVGG